MWGSGCALGMPGLPFALAAGTETTSTVEMAARALAQVGAVTRPRRVESDQIVRRLRIEREHAQSGVSQR